MNIGFGRSLILTVLLFGTMPAAFGEQSLPPPPEVPTIYFEDGSIECPKGQQIPGTDALAFNTKHRDRAVGPSRYPKITSATTLSPPEGLPSHGWIRALVAVSPEGRVIDVMLECTTNPALNEFVRSSAKAATFDPATVDGKPVRWVDTVDYQVRRPRPANAKWDPENDPPIELFDPRYGAVKPGDDGLYKCPDGTSAINYLSDYQAFVAKYGTSGNADIAPELLQTRQPAWVPNHHYSFATVTVSVAVGPGGNMLDYLIECSTDAMFNDSVLSALKQSRFAAGRADGKAVGGIVRLTYSLMDLSRGPVDIKGPPPRSTRSR